jgi:hypothetical protein
VSRTALADRVKKAQSPFSITESRKNALTLYREKALIAWIVSDWNLQPTAKLIEAWANQALARANAERQQVGKNWVYYFFIPPSKVSLAPVKQNLKESKSI